MLVGVSYQSTAVVQILGNFIYYSCDYNIEGCQSWQPKSKSVVKRVHRKAKKVCKMHMLAAKTRLLHSYSSKCDEKLIVKIHRKS